MSFLDLSKGNYPIILKPNLGQPEILNLKEFIDEQGNVKKQFKFTAFIIAIPEQSIQEILEYFYSKLFY